MKTRYLIGIGVVLGLVFLTCEYKPHGDGPGHTRQRARTAMNQVAVALRSYAAQYGQFPIGTNPSIMRRLLGNNPRRMVFIEIPSRDLAPDGSFCDPWGTPYEISMSATSVWIRSAGPNGQFDRTLTSDDLELER